MTFTPPAACECPNPGYDSPSEPCCTSTSCCCHLALDGDRDSRRATSHAWNRIHSGAPPAQVATVAVPLYDLSWTQQLDSVFVAHTISVERESALSLFAALEAAQDFQEVSIQRSKFSIWRAELSEDAEP